MIQRKRVRHKKSGGGRGGGLSGAGRSSTLICKHIARVKTLERVGMPGMLWSKFARLKKAVCDTLKQAGTV